MFKYDVPRVNKVFLVQGFSSIGPSELFVAAIYSDSCLISLVATVELSFLIEGDACDFASTTSFEGPGDSARC